MARWGAFRQVLAAGVRWRLMDTNPAVDAGPNPDCDPAPVSVYTAAELAKIADELDPRYRIGSSSSGTKVSRSEGVARRAEVAEFPPGGRRSARSARRAPEWETRARRKLRSGAVLRERERRDSNPRPPA